MALKAQLPPTGSSQPTNHLQHDKQPQRATVTNPNPICTYPYSIYLLQCRTHPILILETNFISVCLPLIYFHARFNCCSNSRQRWPSESGWVYANLPCTVPQWQGAHLWCATRTPRANFRCLWYERRWLHR